MLIYHWAGGNFIYTGQSEAEQSPLDPPGVYLIPAQSTKIPIPRPVEELAEGRTFKWIEEEDRWVEVDIPRHIPKYTDATAEEQFRQRRNALLRRADWVAIKSYSTGEPMPEEWKNYMQALRDLPENVDMSTLVLDETGLLELSSVPWPTPPDN